MTAAETDISQQEKPKGFRRGADYYGKENYEDTVMLRNETVQQLRALRLSGFADALEEQYASISFEELTFDERLGLLVDREVSKRKSSKIERFIRQARFQNSEACVENIHYHSGRKLDRKLIL